MGVIYTELKKISLTVLIADLAYICASLVFKFFGVHIIVGAVLGYIFMALNFAQLGTTIERPREWMKREPAVIFGRITL